MMEIDNYKQAIAWLRSNLAELERAPQDPCIHLSMLQSFEVVHNLSEAILREIYVSLGTDEYALYLSLRELIWRASEEGIVLSSRKRWIQYGLELETMREAFTLSTSGSISDVVVLLTRFVDDVESFAHCLERRLARNA